MTVSYHRLLTESIRSDYGKRLHAYEALPWWRRLFTRRPESHGGYSVMSASPGRGEMPDDFAVRLSAADADHLLAAAEAVVNRRIDLGPGLRHWALEEAARKIEAVADLQRRGVDTEGAP